ncbi:MAG: hypothetical protein AAB427_00835 [Chloroflexota bacterium]
MTLLHELACVNCGATLRVMAQRGAVISCEYCGTSFRIPTSLTPEAEMGDLLLGADFREPDAPGWVLLSKEKLEFRPGAPAELWATFPASALIHPVLRTPGPFDDFDVSVSVRFIKGSYEHVSAGLEVRSSDDGDYVIRISPQGTFSIGWHNKADWGDWLVKWNEHPSLRTKLGESNRVRVVMRGEQLRLYLNGMLATSLRDSRFRAGFVRLAVTPSEKGELVTAFSDLQLREAK